MSECCWFCFSCLAEVPKALDIYEGTLQSNQAYHAFQLAEQSSKLKALIDLLILSYAAPRLSSHQWD